MFMNWFHHGIGTKGKMAKLDRVHQKIFASTAPSSDIGVIGSLHEGNPTEAASVQDIQSLAAFEAGIRSIVIGENSPIIEEDNALYKLITHQLAYILQNGIPEWDISTDYHTGQICIHQGKLYQSIVDNNLGENPLTSTGKWISAVAPRSTGHVFVNSNYNITADDNGKVLLVNGSAGSAGIENDPYYDYWWNITPYPPEYAPLDMELPAGFPNSGDMLLFLPDEAPPAGFKVTIKDAGIPMKRTWIHSFPDPNPPTSFAQNPVRIVPGRMRAKLSNMWTINQFGAEYEDLYELHKLDRSGGTYELYFDGQRWWITSVEEALTPSEKKYAGGPVFTYSPMNSIHNSTSATDVPDSEVSYYLRKGKSIEYTLIPADSVESYIRISSLSSQPSATGNIYLNVNGTDLLNTSVRTEDSGNPSVHSTQVPTSAIRFIINDDIVPDDQVLTIKLRCSIAGTGASLQIIGCRVMVREL